MMSADVVSITDRLAARPKGRALPIDETLERTTSVMKEVILARLQRGVAPVGDAWVFEQEGWTFAQVRYGGDLQSLVFRLDVSPCEKGSRQ